jgi:hypothetical protein
MDESDSLPEDQISLEDCTCDHTLDEHDWTSCTLCDCKGHLVE